jgi:hypothetical protein
MSDIEELRRKAEAMGAFSLRSDEIAPLQKNPFRPKSEESAKKQESEDQGIGDGAMRILNNPTKVDPELLDLARRGLPLQDESPKPRGMNESPRFPRKER